MNKYLKLSHDFAIKQMIEKMVFELEMYHLMFNNNDNDDIKNAPEYPWLARAHSHAMLAHAKENPMIIHYAGGWPKIWMRKYDDIPKYYWEYIKNSPFYNREFYFPGIKTKMKIIGAKFLIKICPVKKMATTIKKS